MSESPNSRVLLFPEQASKAQLLRGRQLQHDGSWRFTWERIRLEYEITTLNLAPDASKPNPDPAA